jgi:hypothetical protein
MLVLVLLLPVAEESEQLSKYCKVVGGSGVSLLVRDGRK